MKMKTKIENESKKKKKKKNYEIRYSGAKERLKIYNIEHKRQKYDSLFSRPRLISFYVVWAFIFVVSVLYAIFRCGHSYNRLIITVRDVFVSFGYYLTWFFPLDITPTVNDMPTGGVGSILPDTFEAFGERCASLWTNIWNGENFLNYISSGATHVETISKVIVIILPLILMFRLIVDMIVSSRNVDWNIKTRAYKWYEKVLDAVYYPSKRYVQDFIVFTEGHYFKEYLLVLWMCNLNLMSIIVGFIAWYIYFAKAFTFLNVYIQIYKLTVDIAIFFKTSFFALTVAVFVYLYIRWRDKVAMSILDRQEAKLNKIVADLPVAVYITGAPGTKKTSSAVNIALTKTIQYRNEALDRLFKYYMYFPDFPWVRFEKQIQLYMSQHKIYNIASIEAVYNFKLSDFTSGNNTYRYDVIKYRTVYNDGINDIGIWEALTTYAKLYFIYVIETSLLVANFSIREDYVIDNCGNFIIYDNNLYTHPVSDKTSHFAHILNYDTLRVGKMLSGNEKIRNSFEFGVLVCTEFGKERGSHLDNLVVKKSADECNVKNDLLNYKFKFSRHGGVVDNYVFVIWFLDEQKVTSLDPDIRDCCDIIRLQKTSRQKLAIPFFYIECLAYDLLRFIFKSLWLKYRHSHGNRTLQAYLVKHPVIKIILSIERQLNKYGYVTISYMRSNSGNEENKKEESMPLVALKVYKKRYATDTHKRFFRKRALDSELGFNDIPCYDSIVATEQELNMQNSFMITTMNSLGQQNESSEDE